MRLTSRTFGTSRLPVFLTTMALCVSGCRASAPLLSFLDEESSLSFTHSPGWSVGFATQEGIRYRYLTAPMVENDREALSVTLISPIVSESAEGAAQAYLSGASGVLSASAAAGSTEWTFKDPSGVGSRLRLSPALDGRFFGAWVRGSDVAMKRYQPQIDSLLGSLRVENASQWPQARFAGMVARAPSTWLQGSRFSNPTNATMQFRSLPLLVEKGAATIHGFISVAKEPVPAPGDVAAFSKMVKDRASDTVVLLEHRAWPEVEGLNRPAGYADYLRSGTTLTSTRILRWIAAKNGVGLVFSCEARADAIDRLAPWCRRMAGTVAFE